MRQHCISSKDHEIQQRRILPFGSMIIIGCRGDFASAQLILCNLTQRPLSHTGLTRLRSTSSKNQEGLQFDRMCGTLSALSLCRAFLQENNHRKGIAPRWGARVSNPVKRANCVFGGFDSHSFPPDIRQLPHYKGVRY